MKIHAATLLLGLTVVLLGAGCTPNKMVNTPHKDLAVCGDFPKSTGDGDVGGSYRVCLNQQSGSCYLKSSTPKQISGCDPKFSDDNPYGNSECFEYLNDAYDMTGKRLVADAKEYRPEDTCELTTQVYFNSKVKN